MYQDSLYHSYRSRRSRVRKPIGSAGTVAEKLCKYLISKGFNEVPSKTTKYRMFSVPHSSITFYFVGRKGALRRGSCISKSYSVSLSLSAREEMQNVL